ncbi:MAG TPA: non-heme iron oxygenase ferredoxin subunit [Nocardioides sp.]|jgi:3-phenylpropionate/trans-cinnamate dioxygenase ferredoxin subunit|nr:non-heme iron oxygenase ferredoxin subunit [Nocardioides sp.]
MSALRSSETQVLGWEYAADLSELDDGVPVTVDVNGVPVCLVRSGPRIFALLDICSHQDYPLSQGEVSGATLECCVHGACFDLSTGAALTPPASDPVPVYPVRLCEGEVYVLVTDAD